jgi:hypothetical protein
MEGAEHSLFEAFNGEYARTWSESEIAQSDVRKGEGLAMDMPLLVWTAIGLSFALITAYSVVRGL